MHGAKTAENFNQVSQGYLPEYLGIQVLAVGEQSLTAELAVQRHLLAPNGFLHAGTVVTLADGYGAPRYTTSSGVRLASAECGRTRL